PTLVYFPVRGRAEAMVRLLL
uniref:Glutathione-binding protein GST1 n=1 Tax=Mytilus edulis TaxID=6550 RepID=Q7M4A5_MYTED